MLGYVTPDKGELKVRKYEIYSGYYCGICKYIDRAYGQLPRMALSYDAAFLAILLASVDETPDAPRRELLAKTVDLPDYPAALLIAAGILFLLLYDFVFSFLLNRSPR